MVLHYLTHANTETQWKELLRNSKWQVTQQPSRSYVCKCQSDLFSLSASKQDVIVVGLTREITNYWAIVDCVNWLWEWCFIVKSCIVLLYKLWWYDNTPPPPISKGNTHQDKTDSFDQLCKFTFFMFNKGELWPLNVRKVHNSWQSLSVCGL